ncbi:MAG: DUF309 domain-containing protein, partial [Dehalococcoidia bacterium]|nr:DUF309 domain-containing protein [Dehalococcoidia bacterium]
MTTADLPTSPNKAGRRALDTSWLAFLHQYGLSKYLKVIPTPPAGLELAIEEFNQRDYWQCHETLEGLWLPERYPVRLFYHALIKASVGLLHLRRHNKRGATVKMQDAKYGLVPFLPGFMGVNTDRLHSDVLERLAYLHT